MLTVCKMTWLSYDNYNWKKIITSLTITIVFITYSLIVLSLVKAGLVSLFSGRNLFSDDDSFDETEDVPFLLSSDNFLFEIGAGSFVKLTPKFPLASAAEVHIRVSDPSVIETIGSFVVPRESRRSIFVPLHSRAVAGHCIVWLHSTSTELSGLAGVAVRVRVVHRFALHVASGALGWVYLAAWSATYAPQLVKNWRRKSVVGFSFDYVALNLTGHLCYCAFNFGMYFSAHIQAAFLTLHPKGQLPVKLTDVLFSVYAVAMNVVFVVQCLLYERGAQRLNVGIVALVAAFWVVIGTALGAAAAAAISWLQFLYCLAYIKIGSTPMKYAPQVYMNFVRKSTEGWSIHGTLLDGVGGVASFLQMALDAYNNDDLDGTLGNPGKIGLSVIGVIFNFIFIVQHYCLYASNRKRRPTPIIDVDIPYTKLVPSRNKPNKVFDL